MKKFFYIASAAMISILALASCAEKEIVTYNPENAVKPVLEAIAESYVLEDGAAFETLNFSAVEYGIATAARYTLYADVNEDFSSKKSLGNVTTDTVGITVTANTLNNALMSLNCKADVPVTVYFRMEAEMMGESAPVGSVEVLVSNAVTSSITPFNAEKVYPAVYVIGQFCGWDHGNTAFLFSYAEDEENYVGVVDFGAECADYGFKLTGAANWDNGNWGTGDMTSAEPEAPSITLWNDGGSGNISNYSSHRYYNFHFVKSSLTLNMIKGFDLVTVAGAFNGWATDATPMEQIRSNGKFYVDIDVDEAGAADGFKFVLDNGGTWLGAGEIEGAEDVGGGNIALEPGQYRFYLDLNDWDNITYSLSTADYGKPVDGGSDTPDEPDEPENPEDPDQPELQENLWGVIGTFAESNWSADIYMTEFPAGSGIWISPVLEFADTTQFKLRFNNDWNTQAGAVAAGDTLRTGIPTVAGFGNNVAQNVGVAKEQVGKRVVVYDAENNQLYLLGWSVIGAISGDSWGHDFPMIFDPEANTWSVSGLSVEGAFKLRWAGQWSTSEVTIPDRGLADGASFAVGTPISLKQGGGDINPGENVGTYNMVYDVANETLTLTAAE
ncbi:uncharacterized protein BN796_01034 [Alistipes sp. CAG:831]|nr:uncharacterized protein BN796_01034 [Alistipes sp. CAG:831]